MTDQDLIEALHRRVTSDLGTIEALQREFAQAQERIAELEAEDERLKREHKDMFDQLIAAKDLLTGKDSRIAELEAGNKRMRILLRALQEALAAFRTNIPAIRELQQTDWVGHEDEQ